MCIMNVFLPHSDCSNLIVSLALNKLPIVLPQNATTFLEFWFDRVKSKSCKKIVHAKQNSVYLV